jgi:hypothetical protein
VAHGFFSSFYSMKVHFQDSRRHNEDVHHGVGLPSNFL